MIYKMKWSNYFFVLIIFIIACRDENKNTATESLKTENVFDTASGYWVTYNGTLHCNNCDGIKTKLSLFVTPYVGKLKFKTSQTFLTKGKPPKTVSSKGNYSTMGRYVHKKYQSVFQFVSDKNETLFFVREDDNTFRELTNEKKEFANGKKYLLKREN